jgi:hypothetical protein
MKNLSLLAAATFMIAALAGCASWTWSSLLPTMPETPEPESAAPAAAPSASAQANATPAAAASKTPGQHPPVASSTPAASGQKIAGSEWIGKTRREVVEKLGMPLSAVPNDSTGGEMLYYTHYVFESAPGGFIVKATPVN